MRSLFLFNLLISVVASVSGYNLQQIYNLPEDLPVVAHFGRLVQCTPEEKRCFHHGRIFDYQDGKCYVVGSHGNCASGRLYLDREAVLENGSYRGKCLFHVQEKCQRVKETNGNYTSKYGCWLSGRTIVQSLFGEYLCVPSDTTVSPIEVSQPEEEGLCRVPDFRAAKVPELPYKSKYHGPTSEDEFLCSLDLRVFWPADGFCYELLHTEPCEEGQWLILDKEPYIQNKQIIPICCPRPCPKGEVLMEFDGKCHWEKEVLDVWCSGGVISTNEFGECGCEPGSGKDICWYSGSDLATVWFSARSICPESNYRYCPRNVKPPDIDLPDLET